MAEFAQTPKGQQNGTYIDVYAAFRRLGHIPQQLVNAFGDEIQNPGGYPAGPGIGHEPADAPNTSASDQAMQDFERDLQNYEDAQPRWSFGDWLGEQAAKPFLATLGIVLIGVAVFFLLFPRNGVQSIKGVVKNVASQ